MLLAISSQMKQLIESISSGDFINQEQEKALAFLDSTRPQMCQQLSQILVPNYSTTKHRK